MKAEAFCYIRISVGSSSDLRLIRLFLFQILCKMPLAPFRTSDTMECDPIPLRKETRMALKVGDKAPEFTLIDRQREKWGLESYRAGRTWSSPST